MKVALLHGFCETSVIWAEMKALLPTSWQVTALQLPGFGGRPMEAVNSLQDLAEVMAAEVEGQDVFLVGHSLGGYIALEMVKQNTERYSGICLFHSTSRADSIEKKQNRDKTIRFVEDHGKEDFLKNFVSSLMSEPSKSNLPEVVSRMKEMVAPTPVQSILNYSRWMRDREDSLEFLSAYQGMKFYILGTLDNFLDRDSMVQETKSAMAGAVLELYQAGHLGMLEYPVESAQFLIHEIESASAE